MSMYETVRSNGRSGRVKTSSAKARPTRNTDAWGTHCGPPLARLWATRPGMRDDRRKTKNPAPKNRGLIT
jgi:hypothetical protein